MLVTTMNPTYDDLCFVGIGKTNLRVITTVMDVMLTATIWICEKDKVKTTVHQTSLHLVVSKTHI